MAKEVKRRRGTTAEHSTFTGAEGEITVDTDKNVAVVHDGSTAGGFPLAREDGGVPSGTLMLFQQTAAPTGWTKQTTHNNKALRVVSGTASSAGTTAFDSVFGSGKTAGEHTLTKSEIAAHTHSARAATAATGAGTSTVTRSAPGNTGSTGGGGSHNHTLSLDLQYVDLIIASKD